MHNDYHIYESFGQSLGLKEATLKFFLFSAPWYERPFIRFQIWIERVKRYLGADIKLKSDNPFGFIFWFFIILCILVIMIIGKLVL